MKTTFRIPTAEPYAYIELEANEDGFDEAFAKYKQIMRIVKGEEPDGLSEADFRDLYDKVAKSEPIQDDPGMLAQLNKEQRFALNEAKKFVKRNK